jgi:broad specificity polyphosphatase/5'/3'-nucleotidase SurE
MFELLMQVPVTTVPITDQIVTLVTAIGGIVVAVGAIAHSLSMRPELKAHKAALQGAADFMKNVGDHVIASKESEKQLAEVVYDSLPDNGKAIVNKQAVRLSTLESNLTKAQDSLSKVPGALDHI